MHGLENIRRRRLKIALYEDLNDPFEMFAFDLTDRRLRAGTTAGRSAMHRHFGMLCFSLDWSDPVLWSHYADRHAGLCLGFDVSRAIARRVTYASNRLTWPRGFGGTPENITKSEVRQLLFTKGRDWRYEKEARVFARLNDRDRRTGLFFARFSEQLVLREAILGARCRTTVQHARTLVRGPRPGVAVRRARLATDEFRIV